MLVAICIVMCVTDPVSESIVKLWKDAWQEIVPSKCKEACNLQCSIFFSLCTNCLTAPPPATGTGTAVKLYLKDLVEAVCPLLAAQSWAIKRQAAAAIATLAKNAGTTKMPNLYFCGLWIDFLNVILMEGLSWNSATIVSDIFTPGYVSLL